MKLETGEKLWNKYVCLRDRKENQRRVGEGKKIVELAIYWERESHDKYIEQLME